MDTNTSPSTVDKVVTAPSIQRRGYPKPKRISKKEIRSVFTMFITNLKKNKNAEFFKKSPDIAKYPIDLSTIEKKVKDGVYNSPWDIVNDFLQMFKNALTQNEDGTETHRKCAKFAKLFNSQIDQVIQKLGICCGQDYCFKPDLYCDSDEGCTIKFGADYFLFTDKEKSYYQCVDCFNRPGDAVEISTENEAEPLFIMKEIFVKECNNKIVKEDIIDCASCGRQFHGACVLHLKAESYAKYYCKLCSSSQLSFSNFHDAMYLPQNELSKYIESRVDEALQIVECPIFVRVLSSSRKEMKVKPRMARHFRKKMHAECFPYTQKAIYVFQRIDKQDVCLFGLYVQEYNSECPPPNTRRVYIAYMDSVKYFQPAHLRTQLYYEVVNGYLSYVKKLGYTVAHIWASPPVGDINYIFYKHPEYQKVPTISLLESWYKKMIEKAKSENIVVNYRMTYNYASPTEVPYFEGDFWPDALERILKDMDENGSKPPTKRRRTDLEAVVAQRMDEESEEDVMFTIYLHKPGTWNSLPPINDPDPVFRSDIMDTRNAFLDMCRKNLYEFSTLRRAKYSSLGLLHKIHMENRSRNIIECFSCDQVFFTGWYCRKCDIQMCADHKDEHQHPMYPFNLNTAESQGVEEHFKARRTFPYQNYLRFVDHTFRSFKNCDCYYCEQFKVLVEHVFLCEMDPNQLCSICHGFLVILREHSKHCEDKKRCWTPFCASSPKRKISNNRSRNDSQNSTSDIDGDDAKCNLDTVMDGVDAPSLKHAYTCDDPTCCTIECKYIKQLRSHLTECERSYKEPCTKCLQFTMIFRDHAKLCKLESCKLPFCLPYKHLQCPVKQYHRAMAEIKHR